MDKGILQQLEMKRQMMIESGIEHGLQNEKTIQLSRQLDQLINEFDEQRYNGTIMAQRFGKNAYSN